MSRIDPLGMKRGSGLQGANPCPVTVILHRTQKGDTHKMSKLPYIEWPEKDYVSIYADEYDGVICVESISNGIRRITETSLRVFATTPGRRALYDAIMIRAEDQFREEMIERLERARYEDEIDRKERMDDNYRDA